MGVYKKRVLFTRSNRPGVLDHPEGYAILRAQLLQLRHDAVGDVGDALRVQRVHHVLDHVHLVLDGEVDEIGIDEDVEGRPELRVVLEEEGAGALDMLGGLNLIRVLQTGRSN
jgi:hypothetical protein